MARHPAPVLLALALLGSTVLHAAGLIGYAGGAAPIRMAGGEGGAAARLGDGFEDLAAGTLSPAGTLDELAPVPPGPIGTTPQVAAPSPVPPVPAQPATPPEPTRANRPDPPAQQAPAPVQTLSPAIAAPQPATTATAAPVATPAPAPDAPAQQPPTEAAPLPPVTSKRVVAAAPETPAPRPKPRPERSQAAKPKRQDAPARTAKAEKASGVKGAAASASRQGNSDRDARQGSASGTAEGRADKAQARTGGTGLGNGEIESYGGKVLRRILKTRKAATVGKGVAVVAFAIAPDGSLGRLRILRSSGSQALDTAALDHIRRAQPFPKPPAGLKREWTFEFEGRG